MTRLLYLALAVTLVAAGCYQGADPDITDTGKGRPDVTITAPEAAEPGATVEAVLSVSNPGPGDMTSIVVAFSRIGDPSLPTPIVEVGRGGSSEGVDEVTPEPDVISEDGVRFRFGGLAEGESVDITFRLVMPKLRGDVGNAVTVYDGNEPERARGARLAISLS